MISDKLLECLADGGIIRAIGGGVYGGPKHDYVMSTSELYHQIKALEKLGVLVRRIDSGGSPQWQITQ